MKRLALLLAAMGIVSVGAMAEAPKLEVTNFGQEIEIENENGKQTFDSILFANTVGLKYGDWSFAVTGGKFWSLDLDGDGFKSENARLQIDAWRKMSDNLKLGYRLRAQDDYDRHYARWSYANDWFWSDGDVWYESTNDAPDKTDWIKTEIFPIGVKYNNFKLGYFLNYEFSVGSDSDGGKDEYTEHQVRAYWDFYKTDKLTLSFEGRFTLSADNGYSGKEPEYRHYDDFGRIRTYIGANYQVTESLNVYAKYAYEWRDWSYEGGDSRDNYTASLGDKAKGAAAENYQDIIIGWNYKF